MPTRLPARQLLLLDSTGRQAFEDFCGGSNRSDLSPLPHIRISAQYGLSVEAESGGWTKVLARIPRWKDENVLVGFDPADDAGCTS